MVPVHDQDALGQPALASSNLEANVAHSDLIAGVVHYHQTYCVIARLPASQIGCSQQPTLHRRVHHLTKQ